MHIVLNCTIYIVRKKNKILTNPINFIALVFMVMVIHLLLRGFHKQIPKKKKKTWKFVLYFIIFRCHRFITVFVVPPIVKLNKK